jgi:alkylated DNA repair dioxygenase AlkB
VDLFSTSENENLLPFDGEVMYTSSFLDKEKAGELFTHLFDGIAWHQDEVRMFGKTIITKRKVAWYGDKPYEYIYSNTRKVALPWTAHLLEIKEAVEAETGILFNSCLLNLYHDGTEGMGWHSDDEKPLGTHPVIASVSLGAMRKFAFKHKSTKQSVSVILENGSFLLMQGKTQEAWLHALPKMAKVKGMRINLTFRKIEDYRLKIEN